MRGKAKGNRPYLKCFLLKYEKNIFLLTFISELWNLKFPELENWELEVPGIWELRNLVTWELGNLFKGIPKIVGVWRTLMSA